MSQYLELSTSRCFLCPGNEKFSEGHSCEAGENAALFSLGSQYQITGTHPLYETKEDAPCVPQLGHPPHEVRVKKYSVRRSGLGAGSSLYFLADECLVGQRGTQRRFLCYFLFAKESREHPIWRAALRDMAGPDGPRGAALQSALIFFLLLFYQEKSSKSNYRKRECLWVNSTIVD
jgi:hypothetical protein